MFDAGPTSLTARNPRKRTVNTSAHARMVAEYSAALRRSMESPRTQWQLYVFYGKLPPTGIRWWRRLVDRLLGGREYPYYVGQSAQSPVLLRATQHATKKDWAHHVTRYEILPTVYLTQEDTDAAELALIHELRPLFNDVGNHLNPRAVRRQLPRFVWARRRAVARRLIVVGAVASASWWLTSPTLAVALTAFLVATWWLACTARRR